MKREFEKQLACNLKTWYEIEMQSIDKLESGADIHASVYQVESTSAKKYFVKIKSGRGSHPGLSVMGLLKISGLKQMIFPVETIKGDLSCQIADAQMTVFPFVVGINGFDRDLSESQWIKLGACLAKIHSLKIPESLQSTLKREDFNSGSIGRVKALLSSVDTFDPEDKPGLDFLRLFKSRKNLIMDMLRYTEQLMDVVSRQKSDLVLCHGDLHGGNVLLTHDHEFFIVDWDEPVMAPVERDLMFIGGGVGNIWNRKKEEDLFFQGYGTRELSPERLAYYRLERILLDFAEYGEELLLKDVSDRDRHELFCEFSDQFNENGVVDIAMMSWQRLSGS